MQRFFEESAAQRSARVTAQTLPAAEAEFNFLIVGTGMIGREHIGVTRLLGKARVHAIVDTHAASIDAALAMFSSSAEEQPVIYASIAAALADDAIDAILVCTPNYTHYDIIQQVKGSGLPLFIEKPMATTLQQAADIVQLAQSYPGFIQLGMQYRYKSQYTDAFREAKLLGSLGAIKTLSMSEYRPPFLDKVEQWNKFNEYSGGTLVEKCCHYFDLLNLMADARPVSVYASGGQAVNFRDFEYAGRKSDIHDHGFVIINYANGVRASFTLNMFSQELYEEFIVVGEKGRLIATEASTFKRQEASQGQIKVEVQGHADYQFKDVTYPAIIERSGHHGATFFEHEALIAQLKGETVDSATVMQGLWAMIVASAAQEAIEHQQVIVINDYLKENGLQEL